MPIPLDAPRRDPDPAAPRPSPIDGFPRPPEAEARINSAVFHAFTTSPGEAALAYMREISTEAIIQPTDPDSVLRHMEGMRHMVKLIELRIQAARS